MPQLSPCYHHPQQTITGEDRKLEARGDKVPPPLHRGCLHRSEGLYTLREKVCGDEHDPVDGHKLRPTHARPAPLWGRTEVVTSQDVAHCYLVDVIPHVRQCSLNTAVAPGGIILSHAHHEMLNL